MPGYRALCIVLGLCIPAMWPTVWSDAYYNLPLEALTFTQGSLPTGSASEEADVSWEQRQLVMDYLVPYAVCPGAAEVYFDANQTPSYRFADRLADLRAGRLCMRASQAGQLSGSLYFPKPDASGMVRLEFSVPGAATDQAAARREFFSAKQNHYQRLLQLNVPGAAWFRHELRTAQIELGEATEESPAGRPQRVMEWRAGGDPLDETFSLFSGGRAVSENLQLDRQLVILPATGETVAVDSIRGISIAAYDWKAVIKGASPDPDPLADLVPEDQHALFFPSFNAMIQLMDAADQRATPLLYLLESRAEDATTRQRYERQLCLSADVLSRILGPQLVASVAFTGSDPYLRVGSDVAVLFEARDTAALHAALVARLTAAAAGNSAAQPAAGQIAGIAYQGLVAPDRSVCSYLATLKGAVVVSNSLTQLERIVKSSQGAQKSLGSSDEYTFFRERYQRGDPAETALLVLSDATIRRWCGPRWRIGASRRTRAQAVLAELQAAHLADLAEAKVKPGPLADAKVPGGGDITMTSDGVASSIYGNLAFITPILELPLDKATEDEVRAYERFRNAYQRNWRGYFDPIALRFCLAPAADGFDLSLRPLIAATDYGDFIEVAAGSALSASAGDPHPEAILHFVLSVSPEARQARQWTNMGLALMPEAGADAFAWIGNWVSLYVDDAPLWDEILKSTRSQGGDRVFDLMEKQLPRIPLALSLEVKNPIKLTLFLTSLRAMISQTAPDQLAWEALKYKQQAYVKVGPSTTARADMDAEDPFREFALYYAVMDRQLVATLSLDVLKRSVDRSEARRAGAAPAGWLGESLGARVDRRGVEVLRALSHEELLSDWQRRAWANLVALNEWKRRFGAADPVDFHARYWKTRLVEPAGEHYVWNDAYQTMESTRFGHPGAPKLVENVPDFLGDAKRLNLGLTFEAGGLRARGDLQRR